MPPGKKYFTLILLALFSVLSNYVSCQESSWQYLDTCFSSAIDMVYNCNGDIIVLSRKKEKRVLISISPNGSVLWERDLSIDNHGSTVLNVDEKNTINIVSGLIDSMSFKKIDEFGKRVFSRTVVINGPGESNLPIIRDGINVTDTSMILVGQLLGSKGSFANHYNSSMIIQVDAPANVQKLDWVRTGYGTINHIKKDNSGNLILVGTFLDTVIVDTVVLYSQPLTTKTTFIAKLNSSGSVIWAVVDSVPERGNEIEVNDMDIDDEGNIYLAGARGAHAIVVKYDSTGRKLREYSTTRHKNHYGSANWAGIAVNNKQDILVSGVLTDTLQFFDTVLVTENSAYNDYVFGRINERDGRYKVLKSSGSKSERLYALLPYYSSIIIAGEVNGEAKTFEGNNKYSNMYIAKYCLSEEHHISRAVKDTYVFPNPSSGEIWLGELPSSSCFKEVKIYNILGQFIAIETIQQNGKFARLDMGNYPNGTYILLAGKGDSTKTYKVSIQ